MNKPHKWAEVIKAWADGAAVQLRHKNIGADGGWCEWWDIDNDRPDFIMASHIEYRIKPTPPPLRVEDVPLGFPCRLIDGLEFIPSFYDEPDKEFVGSIMSEGKRLFWTSTESKIDPSSIIPTREVWLSISPTGYLGFESKESAENYCIGYGKPAWVYGPIRIPLKPIE